MSQISSLCHTTRSCSNSTRQCRSYHSSDPCLHFWMVSTSVIRDQFWYLEICNCGISLCLCQTRYMLAIGFGFFAIGSRPGIRQDQASQTLRVLMKKCQCCIPSHREAAENRLLHAQCIHQTCHIICKKLHSGDRIVDSALAETTPVGHNKA